jgi:hypothetical protein
MTSSETDDYIAITRLQSAYADCVTRRAWAELGGLFRPDATLVASSGQETITVEGPEAIGALIDAAVRHLDAIFFANLNTRIELSGEGDRSVARARTYIRELHYARNQVAPREIFGVYLDRYVRVDGRWWFGARAWHALARTAPELSVYDKPDELDGWVTSDVPSAP